MQRLTVRAFLDRRLCLLPRPVECLGKSLLGFFLPWRNLLQIRDGGCIGPAKDVADPLIRLAEAFGLRALAKRGACP